jgi:hypothetical protein
MKTLDFVEAFIVGALTGIVAGAIVIGAYLFLGTGQ